jgi:hypothetical protein
MYSSTHCLNTETLENKITKKKIGSKGLIDINELMDIYNISGPNSNEFYFKIKNFIKYLMNKYLGRFDEDCEQECYAQLLESFKYWDPTRSNIVSWIHTVVRNKISSFRYTYKKTLREGYSLNEKDFDVRFDSSYDDKKTELLEHVRFFVANTKNIKITCTGDGSESFESSVFYFQDHPISKVSKWQIEGMFNGK